MDVGASRQGTVILNDLTSLHNTIQSLKEIVQRNQGNDHEASRVVRQIELTLAEIERKTNNKRSSVIVAPLTVHSLPIS